MAKENKVSFRLDDKTMELLNSCEGSSLSDKFEYLVRTSHYALDTSIRLCKAEQERLEKLRMQCREAAQVLADLNQLKMYQNHMMGAYQEFIKSMERLAEGADKL